MTGDATDSIVERPILQQILDEMFAELTDRPDLGDDLLARLHQLADAGQLKKPAAVSEAIRATARSDP